MRILCAYDWKACDWRNRKAKAGPAVNVGTVVMHFHGGGFIGGSSSTQLENLRRYANETGFPVISVDYRLAPETKYPGNLSDCWQAYLWVRRYARKHLGLRFEKVLLTGDSAGGNLLLGVTTLSLIKGIKPPDGLHPLYTPVECSRLAFGPSVLTGIDDELINPAFLNLCI